MAHNNKQTSKSIASLASKTLKSSGASDLQKSLAASALSQTGNKNQTGSKMEDIASRALKNSRSADLTKTLAASVLSQSNKKR